MERIIPFSIHEIRNESLLAFMSQYVNWFGENPEIKAKVLPLYDNSIVPVSQRIEIAVKKLLGSEHTATLSGIDIRRDNAWTGIGYGIKMNLLNPDIEIREAARHLDIVAKNFKGLNKEGYEQQTGGIKALLKELRGKYAKDIEKLGLTSWVNELVNANKDFEEFNSARDDETAKKNAVDIKIIRKDANDVIKIAGNLLNGLAFMESSDREMSEKYDTAFRKLNVILKKFGSSSKTTAYDNDDDDGRGDNLSPADHENEEKYPDAKEWIEDLPFMGVENGDIYYIMVVGKKVFYKLIDKQKFFWHPESEKGAGGWEKLN